MAAPPRDTKKAVLIASPLPTMLACYDAKLFANGYRRAFEFTDICIMVI
jgi:hypothetical protein